MFYNNTTTQNSGGGFLSRLFGFNGGGNATPNQYGGNTRFGETSFLGNAVQSGLYDYGSSSGVPSFGGVMQQLSQSYTQRAETGDTSFFGFNDNSSSGSSRSSNRTSNSTTTNDDLNSAVDDNTTNNSSRKSRRRNRKNSSKLSAAQLSGIMQQSGPMGAITALVGNQSGLSKLLFPVAGVYSLITGVSAMRGMAAQARSETRSFDPNTLGYHTAVQRYDNLTTSLRYY